MRLINRVDVQSEAGLFNWDMYYMQMEAALQEWWNETLDLPVSDVCESIWDKHYDVSE